MKNEQTSARYNILVIGANGGIGRQTVEGALKKGHHVTAVLRNPANLILTHANLEVVKGDIMHPETLERHLENKDVIISAIGKNSLKRTTLYSEGNKNLLTVMNKMGIKRVFFISAAGLDINPGQSFFIKFATKYFLQKLLRNMYADIRLMEKIVKESDSDWTIMRPPRLTDKPATGHYRIAINKFLKKCLTISRADVADFMIKNIANEAAYKAIIEVAY